MTEQKITIVGIGDDGFDGLTDPAREVIRNASYLLGPEQLITRVPFGGEKVATPSSLEKLKRLLVELPAEPTVLLAGGDPLFYGIAQFLTDAFSKDRFEVLPHVSSMQLAFARVKESWDDAYLTNLANQSLDRVIDVIRTAERVGLFTTEEIPPSAVALALLDRRINYFDAYVCENLGTPAETVTRGTLESIAQQSFGGMNVMILARRKGAADQPSKNRRRLFGNPDDAFLQSRPKRGLLTPSEVRSIALSELALQRDSTVWDVGAGSGAVAIEAAMIANEGNIFAIEMDAEDYGLMIENAGMFDVPNLTPIHGRAPEAFVELPDPDAIFVGGSGRMVPDLVRASITRLRTGGRIAVSVSSPDNLVAVEKVLSDKGLRSDVRMVQISRGQYQMERVRFDSLNPVFLLTGVRS
ncbi:MAG: precorrin-6y C5,15-methyltransferase (decarboxylating) subunit CbiE [Planctomycetota bacterium]